MDKHVTDEEKLDNAKYIEDFRNELGVKDDFKPDHTYKSMADVIAREYTLNMPTDTAAVEKEMEAVILLVASDDAEAVEAGKKLGNILTHKAKTGEHNKNLLKAMREAYLKLRDLSIEEDSVYQESIKCISLYDKAKYIFESEHGMNEDGSDYGFDDYIKESMFDKSSLSDINESVAYCGGCALICESLSMEEFQKRFEQWVKNGKHKDELADNNTLGSDEREFRKRMREILKLDINGKERTGNDNKNPSSVQKHNSKDNDNEENKSFLQIVGDDMKNGVKNYLNHFMPKSWVDGIGGAINKAASKIANTKPVTAVRNTYNKLGGNKTTALGTIGAGIGSTLGPVGTVVGGLVGGLAGKGLQKVIDYGNAPDDESKNDTTAID